jgi:hypothetical protein
MRGAQREALGTRERMRGAQRETTGRGGIVRGAQRKQIGIRARTRGAQREPIETRRIVRGAQREPIGTRERVKHVLTLKRISLRNKEVGVGRIRAAEMEESRRGIKRGRRSRRIAEEREKES